MALLHTIAKRVQGNHSRVEDGQWVKRYAHFSLPQLWGFVEGREFTPARVRLNQEFQKLSFLHGAGCSVPAPFREYPERLELWMEYIEGAVPLRSILENGDESYGALEGSFATLRSFHNAGIAHGDAFTKNFMVRDGAVYGIDLEFERKHALPNLFDVRSLAADAIFWLGDEGEVLRVVESGYGRTEKVVPLRGERAYFRARFRVGQQFLDHFFVNGSGQP